jgi:putative hydrolase of the HAD superfamily
MPAASANAAFRASEGESERGRRRSGQRHRRELGMDRGILFDLEGTLVDYPPAAADPRGLFEAGAAKVYALLTSKGCALPSFEQFARQQRSLARRIDWVTWLTGGEPDGRRLLRRLCKDYGLQRDHESLVLLGGLWHEPTAEIAVVAPDVVPTLSALREADVKLGLVVDTIWPGEVIDRHLEALGLLEFFPVRAYSTEHAARKPHPNLFRAALDELHLAAAETFFVGDDPATDVLGARRAGIRCILRAKNPSKRDHRLADKVIERIGQLTDIFQLVPERCARATTIPVLTRPAAPSLDQLIKS